MSAVNICNLALSYLGAEPILALDGSDTSPNAELCARIYPVARQDVLEDASWSFATQREVLSSPLAAGPVYGYTFAHPIPNKALSIIEVTASPVSYPNGATDLDWRLEDRKILSNSSTIYVKYVEDVEDTSRFTAKFKQALAARIAAELAPPITESNAKTEQMWALYDKKMGSAQRNDAVQGRSDRLRSSALLRVR